MLLSSLIWRVYISRHVVFDESILPYASPTQLYNHDIVTDDICNVTAWDTLFSLWHPYVPSHLNSCTSELHVKSLQSVLLSCTHTFACSDNGPKYFDAVVYSSNSTCPLTSPAICSQPPHHTMITRARAGIHKSNPKYQNMHVARISHTIRAVSRNITSAQRHLGWLAAMHEELDTLAANNT